MDNLKETRVDEVKQINPSHIFQIGVGFLASKTISQVTTPCVILGAPVRNFPYRYP
jgi:hypothetical protein